MSRCINVIIVNTHQLFSDALVWRFGQEPDVRIIGTATSPSEALSLLAGNSTDVVLAEIRAEGDLPWLATMAAAAPGIRVCVLTAADDWAIVANAFAAGAFAALSRAASTEELLVAIRRVNAGECYITPDFVPSMLQELRAVLNGAERTQRRIEQPKDVRMSRLTPRELEVLTLLVSGFDRSAIAAHMVLSVHTVGTHVKHLLAKLGVHSTLEAVSIALQAGLRPVGDEALEQPVSA